ncbi:MAG: hypothetical protein JOZ41_09830 [Chloroflexi bacterium]|nr:hypothetical protein [Chloroflexota bacterium]
MTVTVASVEAQPSTPQRPPFWLRLSLTAGNLIQLAGLTLGSTLLILGSQIAGSAWMLKTGVMLAGRFPIYVCCHAIAHWAVGRLVGIEFRGYGLRGTDHPEDYPPVVRRFMLALPTFTVMTRKESMKQARPVARALMFGAGETSTAVCSILAALYTWLSGYPFGGQLFVAMVIFNAVSTVVTARVPRGDYAKARKALRAA